MSNRAGPTFWSVLFEAVAALIVAGLAGAAAWLVWGWSPTALGASSLVIGAIGQTLLTFRRWAAGLVLVVLGVLLSFAAFLILLGRSPAPPPTSAAAPSSPYLLPGVRPWPNGVVPVCWLNRPPRGQATMDDLRMVAAVKEAEETWSAAGAVSFRDIGVCPSGDFHGARLLIGRTIADAEAPALGAAVGEQAMPVEVPFVFPSRSGCAVGARFGGADVCAYGEAVHELGHVLGLADEHYSKAAPDACKATLRQDHPALDVPYDAASVMNACNPDHLFGRLSAADVAAVKQIYGG